MVKRLRNSDSKRCRYGKYRRAARGGVYSGDHRRHKITDEGYSYTVRGEISDVYESTPNSGGYYHTNATYFANGALNVLSGITGGPWTYTVDGKGRPYSAVNGSTNLVSSVTYNAGNQPCVVTLGLGDTDTYVYDNNSTCTSSLVTGRMTGYTFSVGATPTTDVGSLSWNANGTLRALAITDGFNAGGTQTCSYGTSSTPGYDEQGRLVSAVCSNSSGANVWGQSFSYDAFSNLTKSVPSGDAGSTWEPGYNTTKLTINILLPDHVPVRLSATIPMAIY
jgi:hypothetical protein